MDDVESGWLFSLRADRSHWGIYDQFHYEMVLENSKSRGDDLIIDLSQICGTTFSKDYQILPGQGVAIYHTVKARFPKHDIFNRLPRISLIGKILEVDQIGHRVRSMKISTPKKVYGSILTHPFLRNDENSSVYDSIFDRTRQVAWWPINSADWQALYSYTQNVAEGMHSDYLDPWRAQRKIYRGMSKEIQKQREIDAVELVTTVE